MGGGRVSVARRTSGPGNSEGEEPEKILEGRFFDQRKWTHEQENRISKLMPVE